MKKSELIAKRKRDLRAAIKQARADLRSARSHVARIIKPFHTSMKRIDKEIAKLERVDDEAAIASPNKTSSLLDCLLGCLQEASDDLNITEDGIS